MSSRLERVSSTETSLGSAKDNKEEHASKLCQENIRCAEGEAASIYCQECLTYQCLACESFLHSRATTREISVHVRQKLPVVEFDSKMCELWCSPKNPVSVFCGECEMGLCEACDGKMHQGKKQAHSRHRNVINPTTMTVESIPSSHLLLNAKEELVISDQEELVKLLGCNKEEKIKIVSIFGNTGDGKSYTLNHTFFLGKEVFRTSSDQQSCTVGVWTAYSSHHRAIFLDSEGLLGASQNENRRTRLLLKILAISDVVIYRTRAERLHNDMFTFLGDASDAYWKYFTPELKNASDRYKLNIPLSSLGPSVVIFHETQHTDLLGSTSAFQPQKLKKETSTLSGGEQEKGEQVEGKSKQATPHMTAEELLRMRFSEVGRIPKAFCSVEYVGTRTRWPPTDFTGLLKAVTTLLKNNAIRAPRTPVIVLKALQVLNAKFNGDITSHRVSTFPDAYFSCPQSCLACGGRCELSMNHYRDGDQHKLTATRCNYSSSHDNKVYLCKTCYNRGIESIVFPKTSSSKDASWIGVAKYAWSGYVIECKHCGVIYRSREHWYGNKEPELQAVRTENRHIWPEDVPSGQVSDNTARRLLDGIESVAGAVGSVSSKPAQMVTGWLSNQVAPKYWVPDSTITVCGECKQSFLPPMTKHHCRACGRGFCDKCSSQTMPVPWKGWGNVPVRVCNACYKQRNEKKMQNGLPAHQSKKPEKGIRTDSTPGGGGDGVTARYMGEVLHSAMGLASGVLSYPKEIAVESARPTYWIANDKITHCHKCKLEFGSKDSKHHCRACGQGFCDKCSTHKAPVPSRGWEYPVRVCDLCMKLIKQQKEPA